MSDDNKNNEENNINGEAANKNGEPQDMPAQTLPLGSDTVAENEGINTLPGPIADGNAAQPAGSSLREKIGMPAYFSLRNALRLALALPPAVAVVTALVDPEERSLGDIASNTMSNYAAPLTWLWRGGNPGIQADIIKYCQPESRNAAISPEESARRFAEENILKGIVAEHLANPDSTANRILEKGGYPMIVARFSNAADPASTPYIDVRNMESAAAQVCPMAHRSLNFGVRK